ncbi:MAG: hypothetical protein K0S35_664 [Geminicoccaceae bacterium]|nr:hypothetical protein [Geminicoccaceae bacterium]
MIARSRASSPRPRISERQMVALDPPAPRRATGLAEDRHAVVLGMAVVAPVVLDQAERLLERHDVGRLAVARLAQRVAQEVVDRGLGRGAHRLDRHARPRPRHVVPVAALGIRERPLRGAALAVVERVEQGAGEARHDVARGPGAAPRQRGRAHDPRTTVAVRIAGHGVTPQGGARSREGGPAGALRQARNRPQSASVIADSMRPKRSPPRRRVRRALKKRASSAKVSSASASRSATPARERRRST